MNDKMPLKFIYLEKKKDKKFFIIILFFILIFIFFIITGCANLVPWKTKFFIGKWILPLQNTYFTIEFNKDSTFLTRGRRFCNYGTYNIMNLQKNSAIIKVNSISGEFNTSLLVLRYKEGLYIKWANYSQLWYSSKSEKGIMIIQTVSKNIQNIYELETWNHYYLISFSNLGKKEEDLIKELEKPDFIEENQNQKIFYYKNKGEDEFGNIFSYKFILLNGSVIKVESEISVKAIIN